MRVILKAVFASTFLFFSSPPVASMTLETLGEYCKGSAPQSETALDGSSQIGYCLGLLQGTAYTMHSNCILGRNVQAIGKIGHMPENATSVSDFLGWVADNSELGPMDAPLGLMIGLQAIYPCN